MSCTYFVITKTDKILDENKRAEYIKNMYEYENEKNVIELNRYGFDTDDSDSIKVIASPEDKMLYLLRCVVNYTNHFDSQNKANEAAKPIADTIRLYVPEFKSFVFPAETNSLWVPSCRIYIEIEEGEEYLIPSDEADDDIFMWLSNRNISIKDFLFSKKYIIIKSSYEHRGCFANMINKGIIDTTTIENIDEINNILEQEGSAFYD